MSHTDAPLFSDYDLQELLKQQEMKLFEEIDGIDANGLLNTDVEDLCEQFYQKYNIAPLQLREDQTTVDQREAKVDVSQDTLRFIPDRSRPVYVKGTEIRFFIPYNGDPNLFQCRPSVFTSCPPLATVHANEIIISFTTVEHDANTVRAEFDRTLAEIRQHIQWIASDVSQFNASLRDKVRQRIDARRKKLLKDQGLVASLGFPLRRRADAPQTYVVPTLRRNVVPRPRSSSPPSMPEPTLAMKEYENILFIISNMAKVIERSPHAFKQMREEDLRQHFLVQLNGQYEGQATGETFNFEGKTDILIRVEGKNIFIAECKFWRGPDSLRRATDQILSYVSWRDTKTALLVFNRGKNFSRVLAQIPEVIKAHPNFEREMPYDSETGFRYVLRHRDDPTRTLILTVLAFEVPA